MMRLLTLLGSLAVFLSPTAIDSARAGGVSADRECVILLHGLGRTARSMADLEQALTAQGFDTWDRSYPSTTRDIASLSRLAIEPAVAYCASSRRTHFVTHSLGGILVRQYLQSHPLSGRVVMLSPPNHGSEITDLMADLPLLDKLLGPAVLQLGTGPASVPNRLPPLDPGTAARIGVITGNRTADPWFSGLIKGADDGKVSVASAQLARETGFLTVPYGHTFLMKYRPVIQQVLYFLANGRFADAIGDNRNQ
jgi:pimeloyl-ACP methyl ester carboxylesterase